MSENYIFENTATSLRGEFIDVNRLGKFNHM